MGWTDFYYQNNDKCKDAKGQPRTGTCPADQLAKVLDAWHKELDRIWEDKMQSGETKYTRNQIAETMKNFNRKVCLEERTNWIGWSECKKWSDSPRQWITDNCAKWIRPNVDIV